MQLNYIVAFNKIKISKRKKICLQESVILPKDNATSDRRELFWTLLPYFYKSSGVYKCKFVFRIIDFRNESGGSFQFFIKMLAAYVNTCGFIIYFLFFRCRLWDVLESSFTTRVPDRRSQTGTNNRGRKGGIRGWRSESDGGKLWRRSQKDTRKLFRRT